MLVTEGGGLKDVVLAYCRHVTLVGHKQNWYGSVTEVFLDVGQKTHESIQNNLANANDNLHKEGQYFPSFVITNRNTLMRLTRYILATYSKDFGFETSYTRQATSHWTSLGMRASVILWTSMSCRTKYFSWPYTCSVLMVCLDSLSLGIS